MTTPRLRQLLSLTLPLTLPFALLGAGWPGPAAAAQRSAAEIAAGIDRLAVVGRVLYVAAHPDDENSRLLAWLVGAKGLRAGYLSLTRGDGGQNLIGSEQGDLLGIIRTYELLAARAIDGAEQHFTRARDFGYSKSAEESLRYWGHEAMLEDVVRAIRRFRPDIVITRFTPRPPNHGHHTASAMLAAEAFRAAADPARFRDPKRFPGADGQPWQADRLLYNVSTWRLPDDWDPSRYLQLDVGTYDALTGRSWGEVAAESRSQHKSQGFGVIGQRGPQPEYFEPLDGTKPKADVFEGLNLGWGRYPGTAALQAAIEAARKGFDLRAPARSLPALAKVHAALRALPEANPSRAEKLAETERLMLDCAGLHLELVAEAAQVTPGGKLPLQATVLSRAAPSARLLGWTWPDGSRDATARALKPHAPATLKHTLVVPQDAAPSTPLWLREDTDPAAPGLHQLESPAEIGLPDAPPSLVAVARVELEGVAIDVPVPAQQVTADPVRGEVRRAVEVAPAVTLQPADDVVMLPNGAAREVAVTVRAGRDAAAGSLRLEVPAGWRVTPEKAPFRLAKQGDEAVLRLKVQAPRGAGRAQGRWVATIDGRDVSFREDRMTYPHLPALTLRRPARVALQPLELAAGGRRIGYVPGPGDRVAEALAGVGYQVETLGDVALGAADLRRFDAIVVGVRAYNADPGLGRHRARLMRYVEQGGRLVVQYQTNSRLGPLTVELGPYPLTIARGRVTDETAAMVPVDPKAKALTTPNRLGPDDYLGWVQERGLYFAETWDAKYQPVFAIADPGEKPQQGALLVGQFGKGHFVYTGLALFRQLPAGVPGAYRLLANLLAL